MLPLLTGLRHNSAMSLREDLPERAVDSGDLDASERLVLALDGFEGPIDLLLALAREQKVDLRELSVLALAEQYLHFIRTAQSLRLELAADYLVMAAWLAFLKSKMLLPDSRPEAEPSGPVLAEALAFQLRRLDAMRTAASNLFARDLLGEKRFARGAPEATPVAVEQTITASLYDLLRAYARQRGRIEGRSLSLSKPEMFSFEAAIARLARFVGRVPDWADLEQFLPPDLKPGLMRRSALASTFLAGLQMVRQGRLDMRQEQPFGPIHLRSPAGREEIPFATAEAQAEATAPERPLP